MPMFEMTIKSLAPWFGGKRMLAPAIIKELGKHEAYFEPFCGGLAVIMQKSPASIEVVNDLHGDIMNLARVVQHDILGPKLFEKLLRTGSVEDILHSAHNDLEKEAVDEMWAKQGKDETMAFTLQRAYNYFIACWLGRNGECGLGDSEHGKNIAMRWTKGGGDPATRFRSAISSIPAWWERLRKVTILNRDGFDVLSRIKDENGVAIYCDPPYLVKSDKYKHDFLMDDHERLAQCLRQFKRARIVVSYYEHPKVRELYAGWRIEDHRRQKNLSQTQRGAEEGVAPELLIINDKSVN